MKYNCVYYDGCNFSTAINDKEIVNFTKDEIKNILKPILCWFVDECSDKLNKDILVDSYIAIRSDQQDIINKLDMFADSDDITYYREYDKLTDELKKEYSKDKLKMAIKYDYIDFAHLQMIFEDMCKYLGEEEDYGYCSQCGSYNTEYSLTVEL